MMKKGFTIIFLIFSTFGFVCLYTYTTLFWYYDLERIEFEVNETDIDDFAYWIQDIDKDEIEDSKYDLIIIDYSADGSELEEFNKDDVKDMKSSGNKEKFLLSYISIGEAESYRFYWNESWDINEDGIPEPTAPVFLDKENPDWEGNYKVKYWDSKWQKIIFSYIDRIILADFDGIYMDIIDAYEYYEEESIFEYHYDWLMIDFVVNISLYVKAKMGNDFLVFVQNGYELLENSTYLNSIDGIGQEDLFFDDDEITDEDWSDDVIDNLNKVLDEDKIVLVIDYTIEYKYDFYKNCIENGFLPYAAERDLDFINEFFFYPAT
ncbi:MAG TPA: MJ1477/TM1410 family putative glycoside hydrolase [Candidatus Lokiarchaeia archaeon]